MWSSFISSHEFSSCICIRTCTISDADMLILKWTISLRWRWRFETTPLEQTRIFVLRILKRCIPVPPVLAFSPESISRFLVWAYSAFHVCACVMYRWKVISCVISFSCDSMLRELDAFWVSLSISACYDRAAAREWVPFWIKSDCDRSAAGSQFLETLCKEAFVWRRLFLLSTLVLMSHFEQATQVRLIMLMKSIFIVLSHMCMRFHAVFVWSSWHPFDATVYFGNVSFLALR